MIGTSVTSFFVVSLVIALAGLPLARHILVWMDTPPDALPLAEAYLRIIFMGVPFLYMFASLSAILSAVNRAERDRAASPTSADAPISRPGGGP